MAITDIKEYAHLTEEDVEALGRELDAIRARHRRVARRTRRAIHPADDPRCSASWRRPAASAVRQQEQVAWVCGHRAAGGRQDHREHGTRPQRHPRPVGLDERSRRSTRATGSGTTPARPRNGSTRTTSPPQVHQHRRPGQRRGLRNHARHARSEVARRLSFPPITNFVLGDPLQWGVALHHLEIGQIPQGERSMAEKSDMAKDVGKKIRAQVAKDYILFPALTGPAWKTTLTANVVATSSATIGVTPSSSAGTSPTVPRSSRSRNSRTKRALSGTYDRCWVANFHAGPVMAFMSGNLCYQIEHHCSRTCRAIGTRKSRCRCATCVTSTTSRTHRAAVEAVRMTLRTIWKLSLPNRFLSASQDDAPETHSELKFRIRGGIKEVFGVDPQTGKRRGLRTAIAMVSS